MLETNREVAGGEIDALLDLGSAVIVFEIKSSLLTEHAKRSGDTTAFAEDIQRKFIKDRGKPKALAQLARVATMIAQGAIVTAMPPKRIFPVLITDEPSSASFGFNAYLNERFTTEIGTIESVRPLTVMPIEEFEEVLAYSAANSFSWPTILESRFRDRDVHGFSVHQTIFDWRMQNRAPVQRNQFLMRRFCSIFDAIRETYRP
jgi:hypothetical protein